MWEWVGGGWWDGCELGTEVYCVCAQENQSPSVKARMAQLYKGG
eukprot:COSAG02_NODE_30252_length_554_cov_3.424176_1_plen_43_part_01